MGTRQFRRNRRTRGGVKKFGKYNRRTRGGFLKNISDYANRSYNYVSGNYTNPWKTSSDAFKNAGNSTTAVRDLGLIATSNAFESIGKETRKAYTRFDLVNVKCQFIFNPDFNPDFNSDFIGTSTRLKHPPPPPPIENNNGGSTDVEVEVSKKLNIEGFVKLFGFKLDEVVVFQPIEKKQGIRTFKELQGTIDFDIEGDSEQTELVIMVKKQGIYKRILELITESGKKNNAPSSYLSLNKLTRRTGNVLNAAKVGVGTTLKAAGLGIATILATGLTAVGTGTFALTASAIHSLAALAAVGSVLTYLLIAGTTVVIVATLDLACGKLGQFRRELPPYIKVAVNNNVFEFFDERNNTKVELTPKEAEELIGCLGVLDKSKVRIENAKQPVTVVRPEEPVPGLLESNPNGN